MLVLTTWAITASSWTAAEKNKIEKLAKKERKNDEQQQNHRDEICEKTFSAVFFDVLTWLQSFSS